MTGSPDTAAAQQAAFNAGRQDRCPICGSESRHYCSKSAATQVWQVRICSACGHGFIANRPSPELLAQVYAEGESFAGVTAADLEALDDCRQLAEQIARLTRGRGAVLDVGCGHGGFSYHLAKRGFNPVVMLDSNPKSAGPAQLVPRSTFHCSAFEELEAEPGRFDVIVMSHVLEHALDPLDWLRRARHLLGPQGVLAIAVPNFAGVYRLLGTRDPFVVPPWHLQYFTPRSLTEALQRSGLAMVKMDSLSQVCLQNVRGSVSGMGRLVRRAWNLGSSVLNPTRRGIVLRAFAGPASV